MRRGDRSRACRFPVLCPGGHCLRCAAGAARPTSEESPVTAPMTEEADEQQAAVGISTLIHMDDPQHRVVRAIGADWFRPKAMRVLKVRVDELAKRFVDEMLESGDQCD